MDDTSMLKPGLYEQVINRKLATLLDTDGENFVKTEPIDKEEAAKILAKYIYEIVEEGLQNVKDKYGDIESQVEFINKIINAIAAELGDDAVDMLSVDRRAEQLLALLSKKNNIHSINKKIDVVRPETSIAQSSLFTGAIHEPSMFSELKKEILSCDRIDMLVSFIKWSGLRLIIEELKSFTDTGGKLRIITTSYMGATDIKAIEELSKLGNTEIKVSYDTKRTRLHAKAYIFYRDTGYTTAYVGSSNLSNAAISSGLEWNVKATAKDIPDTIKKITATYESYWNSSEFDVYNEKQRVRLEHALKAEKYLDINSFEGYSFNIAPYPYQQEILDKLNAERTIRHRYRNIIVAATGTGKTIISAFDYKRFRDANKGQPCRLLFVAHREEILKQSIACFRGVLKDNNFGALFTGNYRPDSIDHLFVSVQTLNSQELYEKTTADYYDFIIVDEAVILGLN